MVAEKNYPGDVVKWLTNSGYCAETRVIEGLGAGSGVVLKVGEVMRLGTGVKLIRVSSTTGANAMAVLLEPVVAADNDTDCNRLCLVRGPAIINSDQLVFSSSATQKAAALAALLVKLMVSVVEPTHQTTQTS